MKTTTLIDDTTRFAERLGAYGYTSSTRTYARLCRGGRLPLPQVVVEMGRDDLATLLGDNDSTSRRDQQDAAAVLLAAREALGPEERETEPTPARTSLKADGIEVAYRTAAAQMSKRTKAQLVKALLRRFPESERAGIGRHLTALLDTDLGEALVAVALSSALPQVGGLLGQRGPKIERLGHELRLQAGVVVATAVADELLDALSPLAEVLRQLPDPAPAGRMEDKAPGVDLGTRPVMSTHT